MDRAEYMNVHGGEARAITQQPSSQEWESREEWEIPPPSPREEVSPVHEPEPAADLPPPKRSRTGRVAERIPVPRVPRNAGRPRQQEHPHDLDQADRVIEEDVRMMLKELRESRRLHPSEAEAGCRRTSMERASGEGTLLRS